MQSNKVINLEPITYKNGYTFAPKSKKEKEKILSGLTKKQRGFIKDYIETGNGTKAVLNNYKLSSKRKTKKEKTASVIAVENLAKPSIQRAMLALSERIPDDLLVRRHLELLNKREFTRTKDGKVIEQPETQAVVNGLRMAYDLKGLMNEKPQKKEVEITILSGEQKKELLGLLGCEMIDVSVDN